MHVHLLISRACFVRGQHGVGRPLRELGYLPFKMTSRVGWEMMLQHVTTEDSVSVAYITSPDAAEPKEQSDPQLTNHMPPPLQSCSHCQRSKALGYAFTAQRHMECVNLDLATAISPADG